MFGVVVNDCRLDRKQNCFIKKEFFKLKTLYQNDGAGFGNCKFTSVLRPMLLFSFLQSTEWLNSSTQTYKWSRTQKQQNWSQTRLCWGVYVLVYTKTCITSKTWVVIGCLFSKVRTWHVLSSASCWAVLQAAHMLCFECWRRYWYKGNSN